VQAQWETEMGFQPASPEERAQKAKQDFTLKNPEFVMPAVPQPGAQAAHGAEETGETETGAPAQ